MSKLTDQLNKIGIVNAWDFARRGEAVCWIFYHTQHVHAQGHNDQRAVLYFTKANGGRRKIEYRERPYGTPTDIRRACVEAARKAGIDLFGVTGWKRVPFLSEWAWVPQEAYDRVLDDLLED